MANKQIKDYTNLALADTDSLIKQSVTGLTGKTTIADLKANLDGRYQGKGKVIWKDTPTTSIDDLELKPNKIYAFYVESFADTTGNYQIVYAQAPEDLPIIISANFSYAYLDVDNKLQYSSGYIYGVYLQESGTGTIDIDSEHSIKVSKIVEYDDIIEYDEV